ncbi:hypothetical protein I3760_01G193900 [Carya illinoinensis]|nr:hypothetical protein I3760_01G193900 [Carya illinoinensis]
MTKKMKIFSLLIRVLFVVILLSPLTLGSAYRFNRLERDTDQLKVNGKENDRPRPSPPSPTGVDPKERSTP